MKIFRTPAFLFTLGFVLCGCGGSTSSSNPFQGTWEGTGTLVNSSGTTVASGPVDMNIDGSGNVSGSDTVTLDGKQEIESGVVSASGSTLTLSETADNATYSVTATVTLNASNQLIWSGTETVSATTTYTLNYTLTKL